MNWHINLDEKTSGFQQRKRGEGKERGAKIKQYSFVVKNMNMVS